EGASSDWVVLRITREGQVFFDPAKDLLGLGNFEAAAKLFAAYGRKIAFALLGPVGEYLGLLSGIAFSDIDGRPSRLAARG
ncbi:aldehyde ferredoxin oxidoreductase N-terminal domain-containing protein, partial [Acinetobacter baumannii]